MAVRRLFWFSLGAAGGFYAARRGEAVVERARERGLVGNVALAASTATKVATTVTKAGVALGGRARALVEEGSADPTAPAAATPGTATSTTSTPTSTSREVRP